MCSYLGVSSRLWTRSRASTAPSLPTSARPSPSASAPLPGYCHQLAYGKRLELGLADVIVAVAPEFKGQIKLEDLNLTDRARTQDAVRKSVSDPVANAPWDGVDRRIAAS
jgi:hypothetical protein